VQEQTSGGALREELLRRAGGDQTARREASRPTVGASLNDVDDSTVVAVMHTVPVLPFDIAMSEAPRIYSWQYWTPLVSVLLSAAAFAVSILNRRTSSEALRISRVQEDRRKARLDIQVQDSFIWRPADENHRWLIAQVLIVNRSDRDGSATKAELQVGYATTSGVNIQVDVPYVQMLDRGRHGVEALKLPALIKANDALAGWLTFKIDNELAKSDQIRGYRIKILDSRGPTETVEIWALREVLDEAEKDRRPEAREDRQG